jgi:phytanoyl-CoA hydroxylase
LPLIRPEGSLGVIVVYYFLPFSEAIDLFYYPALAAFLQFIVNNNPFLFHSLIFDQGSQQDLHQDTAYVVVDHPLELAACWIALEDIQHGSGELMYVPDSHRVPDWNFGGDRKHWVATEDGKEPHDDCARHLTQHAKDSEYGVQYFLPKKGDILAWHADLAHGGAPVKNPGLTRQSLVGHFCPQGRKPHFSRHLPIWSPSVIAAHSLIAASTMASPGDLIKRGRTRRYRHNKISCLALRLFVKRRKSRRCDCSATHFAATASLGVWES